MTEESDDETVNLINVMLIRKSMASSSSKQGSSPHRQFSLHLLTPLGQFRRIYHVAVVLILVCAVTTTYRTVDVLMFL